MNLEFSGQLSSSSLYSSVLIIIAMEQEAQPFVDHLKLDKTDAVFPSSTPFVAFAGKHKDTQVTVVTFGKDTVHGTGVDNVGTSSASLATFLALQSLEKDKGVDLVISAGTAGGFRRKGAAIGDVFLASTVAHHDRRIPIPGFTDYGIGTVSLAKNLNVDKMATALGYKQGVCTTGNSLDKTDEDDKLMAANDASVKDMEVASIAWSCQLHQPTLPVVGLKVVTDIVDGDVPTQDEFLANLAKAAQSLQEALPIVLDHVSGEALSDLK